MAAEVPQHVLDYIGGKGADACDRIGRRAPRRHLPLRQRRRRHVHLAQAVVAHRPERQVQPRVGFAIDEYAPDWRQTKGVQGSGSCEPVTGEGIAEAAMKFGEKFPDLSPGGSTANISFYRIRPDELEFIDNSGREEQRGVRLRLHQRPGPQRGRMSEVLRVTAGNAAGAEIQLVDELLIGRAVPGDGSLGGDAELSRKHAMITRSAHGLTIEDLGSTNGTFVNGTRVAAQTPLRIGDTISIGASTLEVAGTVPPEQDTSERAVPVGPAHGGEAASGGPPAAPPPAPAGAPPGPPAGAPPAPPPGPPGAPPAAAAPSPRRAWADRPAAPVDRRPAPVRRPT